MVPSQSAALLLVLAAASARADDAAPFPSQSATVRAPRPAADGQSATRIETPPGEWRHAGDVAQMAPGTHLLDSGGLLATATATVRGASSDQVQVTLDGVPLNAVAGGGFDLSLLPAAMFEAIEVRRGADARTGAGAMGGEIALLPARTSRLRLSAGSLGTLEATGAFAHPVGPRTDVLAALDVRRTDGRFPFDRDPTPLVPDDGPIERLVRDNADALLTSALLRAEHRFDAGTLRAMVLGAWIDRGLPGPIYSPTPHDRQGETAWVAQTSWHMQQDAWELEAPLSMRLGRLSRAGGGAQWSEDWALRPRADWTLGEGHRRLRLELSALAGLERFRSEAHGGGRDRLRAGAGVSVDGEWDAWSGSASLRAEQWGNEGALVPRAGASFRLWRGLYLYANGGGGFRPPSFGELYAEDGALVPNERLRPERALSADAGVRLARWGIDASAALFGALYEDVIVYELHPGFRAKPFNVGEARAWGAELSVNAALPAGFSLGGALTLMQTENRQPGHNSFGKELPYRPREKANVRAAWSRPLDVAVLRAVRASTQLVATGSSYATRANTRRVDAFADLRAALAVSFGPDLWLGVEAMNLLDQRNRMALDGYPLPGRVVLGSLSWEPK